MLFLLEGVHHHVMTSQLPPVTVMDASSAVTKASRQTLPTKRRLYQLCFAICQIFTLAYLLTEEMLFVRLGGYFVNALLHVIAVALIRPNKR